MNESAFAIVKDPIPRDRWGRPLVVPPNGGKPTGYTRATTFVSCLDDTSNLTKWKQRMAVLGLMKRPDLQMAITSADPDDKKTLDRLVDEAQEANGASAAATLGTAIHALTEKIDRGEELPTVPLAYVPDLAAYKEATEPLEVLQIETFGVNDDLKIGGTWDRIVRYQGKTYIADVKTGSIDYAALKIAMQLGVYAHCLQYDHTTNTRTPLDVDQDRAIIIHLPAGTGTCELVWVDIKAGWEAVQVAAQVRDWRSRKKLTVSFKDAEPIDSSPAAEHAVKVDEALLNSINTASTPAELSKLWQDHQDIWTDTCTEAAKARKHQLAA